MTAPALHEATRGGLTIADATAADYQRIGDITVDAYVAAGHFDDPDHAYMQFVRQVAARHEHCRILVARRDGRVIASMSLMRHGNEYADIALPGELEIRMLAVDPSVQRSGAGRAMVQAALAYARTLQGVHTVSLTTGGTWQAARALYENLGFSHCPERDWFVPNTDIRLVVYTYAL